MRILDDDAGLFAAEIETESIDGSEACWRLRITFRTGAKSMVYGEDGTRGASPCPGGKRLV
jgi:hypothetical protein